MGFADRHRKLGFPAAFREKTQYRVAPFYDEHSVFTGLGEIKKPCSRPLSGRGLVRTFFSSSAFCAGRLVFLLNNQSFYGGVENRWLGWRFLNGL